VTPEKEKRCSTSCAPSGGSAAHLVGRIFDLRAELDGEHDPRLRYRRWLALVLSRLLEGQPRPMGEWVPPSLGIPRAIADEALRSVAPARLRLVHRGFDTQDLKDAKAMLEELE
jgi:hypothetical protein